MFGGLDNHDNFIIWKLLWNEEDNKWAKRPHDPRTGMPCGIHDAGIRTSRVNAFKAAEKFNMGVGYIFQRDDPYFFIDIDEINDEAKELMKRFEGAFMETSQSGSGVHIIGSCDKDALPQGKRCKAKAGDLAFDSLFTENRFVALTDRDSRGDATLDMHDVVAPFIAERLIGKDENGRGMWWTTEPVEGPGLSDVEVLERALKSKSSAAAFGFKASFEQLWLGDEEALTEYFPPDHKSDSGYDASRADAAMAQHLAFWTAGNCRQIKRIMEMCPGLMREKWENREDYLERTIRRAVNMQEDFYNPDKLRAVDDTDDMPPPPPPPPPPPEDVDEDDEGVEEIKPLPKPLAVEGSREMGVSKQLTYFEGCVYVASVHRIMDPNGNLLKPTVFKAKYGGYNFEIAAGKMDTDAFNVFTQSRLAEFPKVFDMCFRPDLPPHCLVDGKINTYIDPSIRSVKGDVSIFLDHVARILPVEADRIIVLDYMAACVQRPGAKFQWCPVIQGVQGNGKSLLATVMMNSIGERYFHAQDPEDLANTFNAWIRSAIVVCVDEVFVNRRHEMANRMKAMITNTYGPLHPKGEDQRSASNCAKFILFSNHKDAIPKFQDDRRYSVFYTAQQSKRDKQRDGMDARYFDRLHRFIGSRNGRAALTYYLRHRKIVTNMMFEAPETSSTKAAIFESLGVPERIILEAIDTNVLGLRGGILSGREVDDVLRDAGIKGVGPKKRSRILQNIEYDIPDHIPRGRVRVGSKVMKLYIHTGSPLFTQEANKISDIYRKVNGLTGSD